MIELIYPGLNFRFDMNVIFMANYSFRDDVPVDNETFLLTDFMNLKIKPSQSYKSAYRGKMYVHIFIGICNHTCMSIYVCTVFF